MMKILVDSGDFTLIIKGHTHKQSIREVGGVLVINPGSVAFSLPQRKEYSPTVVLYKSQTNSVELMRLNSKSISYQQSE